MKYCGYILLLVCFACKKEKAEIKTSKVDIEKNVGKSKVKEVDSENTNSIKVIKEDSINPWTINGSHEIDLSEELSEQESDSLLNLFFEYFDEYKIKYKSKDTLVDYFFVKNNVLDIEFNYPVLSKKIIENSLIFRNDSIKFELIKEKFNASNYKISIDSSGYIDLINNRIPYGIGGDFPKANIKSIDFYLKNRKVNVEKVDFDYLFEPNFKSAKLYLTDFNQLIFTSWNSDGANGYYLVLFINKDGKTTRIISMP